MSHRLRRTAAFAVGGLAVAAVTYAGAASADSATYTSTCTAQLLSLQLGGNDVPVDPETSCESPGDALFPTNTIAGPAQFPFAVDVLYQSTSRPSPGQATARAGVAHVFLPLSAPSGGQLPDVTVDVLNSQASCDNGVASGESHVVGLDIGGNKVELPADATGKQIPLGPLGEIDVNTESRDGSSTGNDYGTYTQDEAAFTATALHVVLFPGAAPGGADGLDLTIAKTHVSCYTNHPKPPPPPPPAGVDWMTGGGQVANGSSTLTHSLVLPCSTSQANPGPQLNVVWKANGNHHFQLTSLGQVSCSMDPSNGNPAPPKADFNTLTGKGSGTCDGKAADVSFTFTDGGEPNGGKDKASISISSSSSGGCSVSAGGTTLNGDQQAHTGTNPPA